MKRPKVTYKNAIKLMAVVQAFVITSMFSSVFVFASSINIGQNLGSLIIENIAALAWAMVAIGLVAMLWKRNWMGAAITAIMGGIIATLIGDPEKLKSISDQVVQLLT